MISDEIRNWREFEDGTECGGFVTKASFDKLCALADRIDSEMMELPKDADGVPIHVGDTVYGCRSGMEMTVKELRLTDAGRLVVTTTRGLMPMSSKVTHTLPR